MILLALQIIQIVPLGKNCICATRPGIWGFRGKGFKVGCAGVEFGVFRGSQP